MTRVSGDKGRLGQGLLGTRVFSELMVVASDKVAGDKGCPESMVVSGDKGF